MVAKISHSDSLYGVLAYNQDKVEKQQAIVLFTNRMIEPLNGDYTIPLCCRSFENYLLANRRTRNPVVHISLNPAPGDKISDEQFAIIAQEYMEKMGYGGQPYMVYKHNDIERPHIHLVTVRVDEEGKALKDNYEYRRSMKACRELEIKYGLIQADKNEREEIIPLTKVDVKKGNIKHQIANVIRPALSGYCFQSMGEYRALLSVYNVTVEEIKGEYDGKGYTGLMYQALDDNGEKWGRPIKSSRFGKSAGYNKLNLFMAKNKLKLKRPEEREHTRVQVAKAMSTTQTQQEFEDRLHQNGIGVVFRRNAQGRIYGVTFIDHQSRNVFNGSRLGKEYSANVFNERFKNQTANTTATKKNDVNYNDSFGQENNTAIFSEETNLFGLDLSGIYPAHVQEQAPEHKKRKKKHRYGRQD